MKTICIVKKIIQYRGIKMKKDRIKTIRNFFGAIGTMLFGMFLDKVFEWSTLSFALQYTIVMLAIGGIAFTLAAIMIFFFVEEKE